LDKIYIHGGRRLEGRIRISGSKNATLAILAAALASEGNVVLRNVPDIGDIATMFELFQALGCGVRVSPDTGEVALDASHLTSTEAPYEIVNRMRASFNVLGPLLARYGEARVALPGGCDIGARPVDFHLKGLEAMGAEIIVDKGYVEARAARLTGANILMDYPSVTATEHLMATACLAEGRTVIENAAMEPEVVDVAVFLSKMGARIWGAGTKTIEIEGVGQLGSGRHSVIPDRMEAGTYAIAAAITGGEIFLEGAVPEHMTSTLLKLQQTGAAIEPLGLSTHAESSASTASPMSEMFQPNGRVADNVTAAHGIMVAGPKRASAVDLKTMPHPGFPTDMQQPMASLLAVADGCSLITETLFERRFKYISELQRMGANIKTDGQSAIILGVDRLVGCPVQASDLRAGAALVLAALVAEGETEIDKVQYIDRGYSHLVEKLSGVGASICRHDAEVETPKLAFAA
jgi:UDP-N-acetylglucosamine 1-carboxyvinyltransferase